jgi:tetratricopeptide (TPR) repeat protein
MQRVQKGKKKGIRKFQVLLALVGGVYLLVLSLPVFDRLTSHNAEAKKAAYVEQGQKYFQEAKYQDAIIAWKNAVKLAPASAQAYYQLGVTYRQTAAWPEAFRALQKSVQLDPHLIEARLALGELLFLPRARRRKHWPPPTRHCASLPSTWKPILSWA